MSREQALPLTFEGREFAHVLVSRRDAMRRPGVIIFPTVMGVSELELGFARDIVHLGYTALVADLFGTDLRGAERGTMVEAMNALKSDRAALRRQLTAVLEQARGQPTIERDAIVAIGYCFGGLCALDLARSGAEIAGVASFHGLFDPPGLPPEPIRAKVIAFHGWDDPLVPPDKVTALGQELTAVGADWQIHAYGNTAHGFTNPNADGSIGGVVHNSVAADRSWTSFVNFLEEVLGDV